jgi:lysophosphatidylcholine acyltransferase/lyso-PAF acetyltransferase
MGRDDPNSRQNTIKHIVERSDPARDWQQVLIFPEGTCTNRSCLITFRTGAFVPGVAVQPVIIRWGHQLSLFKIVGVTTVEVGKK